MQYKKSYVGLVVWIIVLIGGMIVGMPLLSTAVESEKVMVKLTLLVLVLSILLLMLVVHKGQYVYWMSGGPTYEEAKSSTPERRKRYTWRLLRVFLIFSAVSVCYLIISFLCELPVGIDIVVVCISIVVAAICTMGIRF